MKLSGFAAAAVALMLSGTALAQSGDMVVMRRQIQTVKATGSGATAPTPTPTPIGGLSPTDPGYYSYKVTAWQQAGACGSIGTETRMVSCVRTDGLVVADALCTGKGSGPRPISSRDALITATCSYAWDEGDWSQPTNACGTSDIVRDVSCVRSDRTVADPSLCPAPVPPSRQSVTQTGGCGYVWTATAWSQPSAACGDGPETRAIACQRTDGAPAAVSSCTGDAPPATQHVYTACSGDGTGPQGLHWVAGTWGAPAPACGTSVASRSVTCQDTAGTVYADALCTDAKPATTQPATDYSTCTDGRTAENPYGWTVGAYGAPSTTCGTATSTRSVVCTDGTGAAVSDGLCTSPKPDASTTRTVTDGCTYAWAVGDYGPVTPGCGATQSTRAVYCRRSDGTGVTSGFCSGQPEPDATQPATDYSACSFGWTSGPYGDPSTTCGDATQTRTVSCERSDGTAAPDASCNAGARPVDVQSTHQVSGCSVKWAIGDWTPTPACGSTTSTRTVSCLRSDGQTVDDGQCAVLGDKPATSDPTATDYSTCTFDWSVGTYPTPATTCGTSTQTRSVVCQRSDLTTAPDAQCAGRGTKPDTTETTTQTSTCTYAWSPEAWGAATPACGASTHSRTVDCRRSDGTPAASSFCTAANTYPTSEATTDYSTCTYKWAVGDWQGTAGCGDTVTQNRSVTCQRSDQTSVADAYCGSTADKPASSQPITDYSQCTYSWSQTKGSWSGTCSATATRTNVDTCTRQDGQVMTDQSYCNASTKPALTDTGNFAGCTYSGTYGAPLGVCTAPGGGTTGTQTTTLISCQRSDGTDYTSQNASGGYAQCAKASTQTCTMPVAAAVTCPTTPTSRSGITNVSSYTQTPYSGGASAGIALAKSMDGSKKYYLVLQYAAQPKYNIVYAGDVAPNFGSGTFSNVSTDGYYVCTGAK